MLNLPRAVTVCQPVAETLTIYTFTLCSNHLVKTMSCNRLSITTLNPPKRFFGSCTRLWHWLETQETHVRVAEHRTVFLYWLGLDKFQGSPPPREQLVPGAEWSYITGHVGLPPGSPLRFLFPCGYRVRIVVSNELLSLTVRFTCREGRNAFQRSISRHY